MTKIRIFLESGQVIHTELDEEIEDPAELSRRVNQTSGPRWIVLGTALVFSHGLQAIELA